MRLSLPVLVFTAAIGLVAASPVRADDSKAPASDKAPALVVAISVDQFSADLFAQYRQHFTKGFARLLQGAVFPSGFQSHAATETCPGHSTLLTGDHPARTGIIANYWFEPAISRKEKRVYCAEDETDPASSPDDPVVSARHLKVPTLGDRLKAANPKSLNVAVSAKDRAAVMMGGHDIDAAYWWRDSGFTTFRGRKPDPAVQEEMSELAEVIADGTDGLPVPDWCEPRDHKVAVGGFSIGTYKFALPPNQPGYFGRTPYIDSATGSLAIRLVDEYGLGKDDVPDVLSVSFSATDYVGHAFGHEGVEMCVQLAQLDQTIGKLLDALDARGIDYVVALTADHGGIDAPERLNQQAYPQAQRMSPDLTTGALSRHISEETGVTVSKGPLLLGGVNGDIYLSAELSKEQRRKVAVALIAYLEKQPQVAAVFNADQLEAAPMPSGSPQDWSMLDRVRASFDPERSGDLLVMLKRGVVPVNPPKPGIVTTHGSPWDYDRRVPMLFWRKGLAGFEQPAPVETVDIAPTLAALLHLKVRKGDFDGRCLDIDGGPRDTCAE